MIAVLLISGLTFSQVPPPRDSQIPDENVKTVVKTEEVKKSNWGKYVSFSASFSNQTETSQHPTLSTLESSYFCFEAGLSYKNLSGGLGIGRNFGGEISSTLYLEPRFYWNFSDFTAFKAGVIGGFGSYLNNSEDPFLREYGIGTELDSDYINYTIQFTNWGTPSNNANYFSVGITKSF